jgi:transposase
VSFPRAGGFCAARFPAERQPAAKVGLCPVTRASGESRGVVHRWACDKRLRAAVTRFADNPGHSRAVRVLARAQARAPCRAWDSRRPCDPASHAGAVDIAPRMERGGHRASHASSLEPR